MHDILRDFPTEQQQRLLRLLSNDVYKYFKNKNILVEGKIDITKILHENDPYLEMKGFKSK
jgi:hypothetical protein